MSQEILMREIIARSRATDWESARREWTLEGVQLLINGEASGICLCGHQPIRELCEIANQITGVTAVVGNCCVKRLLGLPSQIIFDSIRRVEKDETQSFNLRTLTFLRHRGVISSSDFWESVDTCRWRTISENLRALRLRVNAAGLSYFRRQNR